MVVYAACRAYQVLGISCSVLLGRNFCVGFGLRSMDLKSFISFRSEFDRNMRNETDRVELIAYEVSKGEKHRVYCVRAFHSMNARTQ